MKKNKIYQLNFTSSRLGMKEATNFSKKEAGKLMKIIKVITSYVEGNPTITIIGKVR